MKIHSPLRTGLLGAVMATLGVFSAQAASVPQVSIGDASVIEGNAGATLLNLPVTRTGDITENIALSFQTDDSPSNPATAGTDYVSVAAGNVLLPAGATRVNLPITVNGDTAVELDEQFLVHLLSAINAGPTPNYTAATNFAAGPRPFASVLRDFNGDGRADLAAVNQTASRVSVLLSTTAPGASVASFGPASTFGVGVDPRSLAAGDFNGDGRPDLVVANASSGSVSILLNTTAPGATTASFAAASTFGVGSFPTAVAVGDLNGDGRPDLAVSNQTSNSVSVLLNTTAPGAAAASFAVASSFAVGSGPQSVVLVDLNGDSRPDLATANLSSNTASVLLNTGAPGAATASFAVASSFGVGSVPTAVAAGDFDGDGRPDLAVTGSSSGFVSVLRNTTAPGAPAASFVIRNFATGSGPQSVAVDDLNGDGRPDLAVLNFGNATLAVLLNTTAPGAPNTSFAAASNFGVGSQPQNVALGDLNGDGRPDVAVASPAGGVVSVLINATVPAAPAASFAAAGNFGAGSDPQSVAVGDLNGDGRPDLALANSSSDNISVLLNTSAPGAAAASFAATGNFAVGDRPYSVAVGDLNGDGRPDLASANFNSDTVSVLLNTGAPGATTASFAAASNFDVGSSPQSVAVSDLNGDGRPDIAVVNSGSNTVSVVLNTTAPGAAVATFAVAGSFGVGIGPTSITVGDLNGDGRPDIAVSNLFSASVSVLLNTTAPSDAAASFAAASNLGVVSFPLSVTVGDLNGDGRPDLAAASVNNRAVSVLINTTAPGSATATFAAPSSFTVIGGPRSLAVGDLNGDGRLDLVSAIADSRSDTIAVLLNSTAPGATTATFAGASNFSVGGSPASVAVSDLNGDGRPDLAVANSDSDDVTVLLNQLYRVSIGTNEATATIVNDDVPPDTTPDAFTFADVTGVAPGSLQTSNVITVSGINAAAPVAVIGGFYGINGGPCTQTSGTVSAGDRVVVCHTAASTPSTRADTTLTIGADGVLTGVSDTFSSTTVAAPTISLTPTALDFGRQFVLSLGGIRLGPSSPPQTVVLTNTGAVTLTIASITTSSDFLSASTCGATVAPGASCTINIVFRPNRVGIRTGTTTIVSNASNSPSVVQLRGTGVGLLVLLGAP